MFPPKLFMRSDDHRQKGRGWLRARIVPSRPRWARGDRIHEHGLRGPGGQRRASAHAECPAQMRHRARFGNGREMARPFKGFGARGRSIWI